MTICTWLRAVYISLNFFLYSAMAALELAGIVHGLTRGMVKGLTLQSWQNSFSVCRILLPCHAFMGRACLPNSAQVSDSAICPTCQGRMWSKGVFFFNCLNISTFNLLYRVYVQEMIRSPGPGEAFPQESLGLCSNQQDYVSFYFVPSTVHVLKFELYLLIRSLDIHQGLFSL